MTERKSDNAAGPAAVTPAEGVRIIGAAEAQTAVTGDQRMLDLPRREREDAESDDRRQRKVAYPDAGPSWSAADDRPDAGPEPDDTASAPAPPESGEIPPLPHWTEPPTGAVPAIFADDSVEQGAIDDDFDVWAPVTGTQPRFRAEGSDWADADFSEELSGEHERLGALDEEGPVDEEAEFAEALAERRRRPARAGAKPAAAAAAASVPTRPRPPRRPEPELTPPGPARSRDLPTAIMTAATVAIVALVCFSRGTTWTAVLASIVVGMAALEFCNALRSKGMRCATLLSLTASLTLPLAVKHYGASAYPIYFALIVVFSMLWFLWEVTPGRPLIGVSSTVLSFAYVGGLGGFAGLLLAQRDGVGLILGVAICTIAYDVVGFFVGSQFGRTPIAPKVSPHKSVEGTVAGMFASLFFGAVVVSRISPWDLHHAGLLLGLLVAAGAFLGDLCESMIKRDLGLKDFGALLPGHGGVLDRFDGLLFCLPIAYYLAVSLKI